MIENCRICDVKLTQNYNNTRKYCSLICKKEFEKRKYGLKYQNIYIERVKEFTIDNKISYNSILELGLSFLKQNPDVVETLKIHKLITGKNKGICPIGDDVALVRKQAVQKLLNDEYYNKMKNTTEYRERRKIINKRYYDNKKNN